MALLDAIKSRRSIRKYQDKQIPSIPIEFERKDDIEKIKSPSLRWERSGEL